MPLLRHWAVPLSLAEGSFAGLSRKCAWSGWDNYFFSPCSKYNLSPSTRTANWLSFSIFLLSLAKWHWTSFDHLIDVNKMVGHWLPQVDYRLPPSCSTKLMQAWLCTRSCVGSRRPFSPCWWHRNTGTGNFGFRVIRGRKAEAFLVILGLQLNCERFNINFND